MQVCITADIERFSDAITKFECTYAIDDARCMRTLLDIFCDCNISSTLFLLGRAIVEEPIILDMARENGFELASHGYTHRDFRTLSSQQLREELEKSTQILPAKGFRAPYYGFQTWMIQHLQHHFLYDSSKVSGRNKHLFYHDIHMLSESLMEIPVSSMPLIPLPLTSTAIRWLPFTILKKIGRILVKKPHPLILNVHPWECVAIPRDVPVPFYVKKNTGRAFYTTLYRLLHYLKGLDVEFITMGEVYETQRF
jgi:peptidoglycan/xylan/chitin deacetylase (PgdA/CDA1 family)